MPYIAVNNQIIFCNLHILSDLESMFNLEHKSKAFMFKGSCL